MSEHVKLRISGFLILAAFPLYGGGQALLSGDDWPLGLGLVLSNSAGVILIGFLMRGAIATARPGAAIAYLLGRIGEGVLLALGAFSIVNSGALWGLNGADFYHLGMISLGLASLPMCLWLVTSGRMPRAIGWLGFGGYFCLVMAMVAADRGFETASMVLLMPGAIFELIFGGLLVLGRGGDSQGVDG